MTNRGLLSLDTQKSLDTKWGVESLENEAKWSISNIFLSVLSETMVKVIVYFLEDGFLQHDQLSFDTKGEFRKQGEAEYF